jgi:3-deoxy-D-manno-octulosonic-acid transferase
MNFSAVVQEFLQTKALIQLPKTDEKKIVGQIAEVFTELLQDAERRERLAKNAFAVMEKNRGATTKTIEYLQSFLQARKVR